MLTRRTIPIRPGPHTEPGFGGNDQFITMSLEVFMKNPGKPLFCHTDRRAVGIRLIKMGDAMIKGGKNHRLTVAVNCNFIRRTLGIRPGLTKVMPHTEADQRKF